MKINNIEITSNNKNFFKFKIKLGDVKNWVWAYIVEERYKIEENYKVELQPIDYQMRKQFFYVSDLNFLIYNGHIKMEEIT